MTRHWATVCRYEQLPVLLGSMRRHCAPFILHALAWDWDEPDWAPDELRLVRRRDFLARHPHLEHLPGPPRSAVDTVATVRWQFYCDLLNETNQPLAAIDGDMWFWSSPEPMFEEIGAARMAVSPHRIPVAGLGLPGVTFETHRVFGLYNAGLVYMADPAPARELAALNFEWSYTALRQLADGRVVFGDQGWLEQVAHERGAHVIRHPGVNVAPWNVHQYEINAVGGGVQVGGHPLVCYHYSSFRRGERVAFPDYAITSRQAGLLYAPYAHAFEQA